MVLGFSGGQLFGIAMFVVGAVVVLVSTRYVWRAAGVYRARLVTDLSEIPLGTLVRVEGTARKAEAGTMTAPFTGRESLALRYAVEERRLSPYLLPWFVTIHEQAGSNPFRLRTAGGVVAVGEPTRTVTLARDVVATVGADETPPERIERFERNSTRLQGSTIWRSPPTLVRPVTDLLSLGTRRYREECVGPGDEVTAVGRVTEDGHLDPYVLSDRPRGKTLRRMAGTSLAGLAVGGFAVAVGVALWLI